ncbi:MAG: hypothetical protein ACJA1U_002552 [Bermanella sp.]
MGKAVKRYNFQAYLLEASLSQTTSLLSMANQNKPVYQRLPTAEELRLLVNLHNALLWGKPERSVGLSLVADCYT